MRCATAPVPHLAAGFDLRPAEAGDAALVARWMAQEHVRVWWDQAWPVERWAHEIATQAAGEHSVPCIASYDGGPVGYLELYLVRHDVLAGYYDHDVHDRGLHVAIGDAARTGAGLGRRLLASVAEALFDADPACHRVVAEPDVRNEASVRAFAAAGFERVADLGLPGKTAALMVRSRGVGA
ncbi:MAG TPA: GNAT family N-acetyltransferase [Kribbellaceae bacterium]|jgi:RimJ/RimL family protein N-acetyltransferase